MTRFPIAAALLLAFAPSAQAAIPSGPTTRDAYDVWTIGDSYASGEGAPDTDGIYNDDGDVISNQFEDWDTRFGGPPSTAGPNQDSTRCHRSGNTSPSAVATTLLRTEFPDVDVKWTSVACGGASIVQTGKFGGAPPPNKGGILTPYDGAEKMGKRGISADKLVPKVYPPQLEQINTAFNGRVDALLMNLGGNDAGFAELIQQCLNIFVIGDCHTNQSLNAFVDQKLGVLNSRFDRLAAALAGTPQGSDPELEQRPRAVFLTKAPMPLRPSANSVCNGTPAGNYEANLKAAETQWLIDRVVNPLNARFEREATDHGWNIVEGHVNQFVGHAICNLAPANWINQNLQALRKQGELDETEGLPLAVSGGIAHPNREGYAVIGAALRDRMRPVFMDHYTPDSAPATTTSANAAGFSVSFNDSALEPLSSGYWHRVRVQRLTDNGLQELRDLPYGTASTAFALTGRFFVVARACGPLSRNGARGCSPATTSLPVSTFVPARPVDLTADGRAPKGVLFPTAGITVRWKHANANAAHDTRRSIVRLVGGGRTTEHTVQGPFTTTRVNGLRDGERYSITVKACNDGGRCSATLGPVSVTADQGESPLTQPTILDDIAIAVAGVPCLKTPVLFDPSLAVTEDPTPTFAPQCIGEPPVGRLRLASTRGGKVDLRWRTPLSWRALRDVSVQFVGRRGVLATLRFEQNRNRLTLGRRSLAVGRAGVLRSRGVTVRLRKDAVRASGAVVRMRFTVTAPRRTGIAIGARDDSGQQQPLVPAGALR
ncbi:MAG TPA: hypothetical protein VFZ00_18760 [Solirubrobacter sp.]|nr:hypothetical protein [Solirubrobacter sp.]